MSFCPNLGLQKTSLAENGQSLSSVLEARSVSHTDPGGSRFLLPDRFS